jgi:alpha-L-fucosidase
MSYNYWRSPEFLAWLYNESPVKDTVVTNDRWGNGSTCLHGGYLTCQDHYLPGKLVTRKWEDSDTIDKHGSYGYRRTITV